MSARKAVAEYRAAGLPFEDNLPQLLAYREYATSVKKAKRQKKDEQNENGETGRLSDETTAVPARIVAKDNSIVFLHPVGYPAYHLRTVKSRDALFDSSIYPWTEKPVRLPIYGEHIWSLYGPRNGKPVVLPPSTSVLREWIARRLMHRSNHVYPNDALQIRKKNVQHLIETARIALTIHINSDFGADHVLLSANHLFTALEYRMAYISVATFEGRTLNIPEGQHSIVFIRHVLQGFQHQGTSIVDVAAIDTDILFHEKYVLQ